MKLNYLPIEILTLCEGYGSRVVKEAYLGDLNHSMIL